MGSKNKVVSVAADAETKAYKRIGEPHLPRSKPDVSVPKAFEHINIVPKQQNTEDTVEESLPVPDVFDAPLEGYELYAELRDNGFPQGGVGNWIFNIHGTQKAYIPHPSEVYQQYIANPDDWEVMTAAMSNVWLQQRTN